MNIRYIVIKAAIIPFMLRLANDPATQIDAMYNQILAPEVLNNAKMTSDREGKVKEEREL